MFKLVLEKAEGPEIKLPTSTGSSKKWASSRKSPTSALLTMPKPLTVWTTSFLGKGLMILTGSRWPLVEYGAVGCASWSCQEVASCANMETIMLMMIKEARHAQQSGVSTGWVLSKFCLLLPLAWLSDKTQAQIINFPQDWGRTCENHNKRIVPPTLKEYIPVSAC